MGFNDEGDLHTFNKIPKWTAGLSTGFYYKNFRFECLIFYTRQKYGQLLGVLSDEAWIQLVIIIWMLFLDNG